MSCQKSQVDLSDKRINQNIFRFAIFVFIVKNEWDLGLHEKAFSFACFSDVVYVGFECQLLDMCSMNFCKEKRMQREWLCLF